MFNHPTDDQMIASMHESEQTGEVSSFAFKLGWQTCKSLFIGNDNFCDLIEQAQSQQDFYRIAHDQTNVTAEFAFNLGYSKCLQFFKKQQKRIYAIERINAIKRINAIETTILGEHFHLWGVTMVEEVRNQLAKQHGIFHICPVQNPLDLQCQVISYHDIDKGRIVKEGTYQVTHCTFRQ